jgi:prevent-host-death family protein
VRTMAAGEFKAKCLKVIDEVGATGEPVLVTKRGKPVASVVPLEASVRPPITVDSLFGALSGLISIEGDPNDLVGPIIPLEDWEHLKDDWSPFPSE